MQAYNDRLYAVINCSNLVEVMSLDDATHVGEVAVPDCRYIVFRGDYAYVSSYQSSDDSGCGDIYKVELSSLTIVDRCQAGYQPEQMVVQGDKLYVTTSVKYASNGAPTYDNRVMVIDLNSFEVVSEIEVAINLHQIVEDSEGMLWVSSRGDYADNSSKIYRVNPTTELVISELDVASSSMTVSGEYLYIISSEYSYITLEYTISWAVVYTPTESIASRSIITDGSDANISQPYAIAINPETEDIYITDAKGFVVPGTLHCYSPAGELQWSVTTGDIPAKMIFRNR
ncbi:MAG: YncE family protein [Rikenellaceae bacterium]